MATIIWSLSGEYIQPGSVFVIGFGHVFEAAEAIIEQNCSHELDESEVGSLVLKALRPEARRLLSLAPRRRANGVERIITVNGFDLCTIVIFVNDVDRGTIVISADGFNRATVVIFADGFDRTGVIMSANGVDRTTIATAFSSTTDG